MNERSKAEWTERERHIERENIKLMHAIQSGVLAEIQLGKDASSPKHLRTGLDIEMVRHAALVDLLIDNGLIDREDYLEKCNEYLKREVQNYQKRLTAATGRPVILA